MKWNLKRTKIKCATVVYLDSSLSTERYQEVRSKGRKIRVRHMMKCMLDRSATNMIHSYRNYTFYLWLKSFKKASNQLVFAQAYIYCIKLLKGSIWIAKQGKRPFMKIAHNRQEWKLRNNRRRWKRVRKMLKKDKKSLKRNKKPLKRLKAQWKKSWTK